MSLFFLPSASTQVSYLIETYKMPIIMKYTTGLEGMLDATKPALHAQGIPHLPPAGSFSVRAKPFSLDKSVPMSKLSLFP